MSSPSSPTHHTTDIEAFMQGGDIRRRLVAAPYPATKTVQVRRPYHPGLLVEITSLPRLRATASGTR